MQKKSMVQPYRTALPALQEQAQFREEKCFSQRNLKVSQMERVNESGSQNSL